MKINKLHWAGAISTTAGIALYYGGYWWMNYTLTHSAEPRIDFNFAAAIMMMFSFAIIPAGVLVFIGAFFLRNKKPAKRRHRRA